jgi:hypothetical protein
VAVFFLRAGIIQRALDLASAVTTYLTAGGLVAQSVTILFQVCLLPSRLCAPVSHGVSAVSSLDWARDPEQVEGPRILVKNVGLSVRFSTDYWM